MQKMKPVWARPKAHQHTLQPFLHSLFSEPEIFKMQKCKNERLRDPNMNCSFYRAALKEQELSLFPAILTLESLTKT